jgi:hypothetical protein
VRGPGKKAERSFFLDFFVSFFIKKKKKTNPSPSQQPQRHNSSSPAAAAFNISTVQPDLSKQSIIPQRSQVVCTVLTGIAASLTKGIICNNF